MKKTILFLMVLIPFFINAQIKKERYSAFIHYSENKYDESFKDYSNLSRYMIPIDLFNLAEHYYYGFGTEKNLSEAIKYYKLASERGLSQAQLRLCEIIIDGNYLENDIQKVELYRYSRMYCSNIECPMSTGDGEDKARYALYQCYKNGWGTKKNPVLADIWLSFAAFNESIRSQEEFESLYGIDSDKEEWTIYFNHLYDKISSYIQDDKSIEISYFRIVHLIAEHNSTNDLEILNRVTSLYENPNLSIEGKATLYMLIKKFAKYNQNINKKYGNDEELYELVSDEEKLAWEHAQFTKVVWKVDVLLNQVRSTGTFNGHNWVDLGLPSGTKWSNCNIGAGTPTDPGALFAWSETKQKKKFTPENFIGDKSLFILGNTTDAAYVQYGDNWSMPSCEDWDELFTYCDIQYDINNKSIVVTSPNRQTIIIPYVQNSEKDGVIYWTNTCISDYVKDFEKGTAISLLLEANTDWGFALADLWRGCPVRPVLKDNAR